MSVLLQLLLELIRTVVPRHCGTDVIGYVWIIHRYVYNITCTACPVTGSRAGRRMCRGEKRFTFESSISV